MRRVSSSNARSQTEPTLLVFGIDRKRKARAAWFGSDDEPQAAKVAERAGYVTCKLTPDIRRDLSARVPSGRVSRSGRVFAPVVPAEVYRDLVQAAGASTRPTVDEPSASDPVESGDVRTDGCSPPSGDGALIPDLSDPAIRLNFAHRLLAAGTGVGSLALFLVCRNQTGLWPLATLALVLVLAEIGLGGLLVLWQVPLATALLHQALGVLAFGAISLLMWRANAPVSNGQALHVGSLSRA